MGIPYELIGIGLGFGLGVWAFIEADTVKGRVFIAGTMLAVFLLPVVLQSRAASVLSLIGWTILGLGCYIFLRYRGAGLP